MAGILACGEARRPNERGELPPPWLKIVVVLEDSAKHTPQVPKITVLTPRHRGQSATVMEGLTPQTLRAA